MDIKFKRTSIPETTRPVTVNPFRPVAEAVMEARKANEALTVDIGKDVKQATALRKIRELGEEFDVTFRIRVDEANPQILTVWAVDRITREKKPKDGETK